MTTTSQTAFLSEILGGEPIPAAKLAYFRRRLRNRIHASVLKEFIRIEKLTGLTRAELARRIGCKPEQITRRLGMPGNWTLDTVSDLLLAMGCEPALSVASLADLGKEDSAAKTDSTPLKRKIDKARVHINLESAGKATAAVSTSET